MDLMDVMKENMIAMPLWLTMLLPEAHAYGRVFCKPVAGYQYGEISPIWAGEVLRNKDWHVLR